MLEGKPVSGVTETQSMQWGGTEGNKRSRVRFDPKEVCAK